jgi:hypothetical protein
MCTLKLHIQNVYLKCKIQLCYIVKNEINIFISDFLDYRFVNFCVRILASP